MLSTIQQIKARIDQIRDEMKYCSDVERGELQGDLTRLLRECNSADFVGTIFKADKGGRLHPHKFPFSMFFFMIDPDPKGFGYLTGFYAENIKKLEAINYAAHHQYPYHDDTKMVSGAMSRDDLAGLVEFYPSVYPETRPVAAEERIGQLYYSIPAYVAQTMRELIPNKDKRLLLTCSESLWEEMR